MNDEEYEQYARSDEDFEVEMVDLDALDELDESDEPVKGEAGYETPCGAAQAAAMLSQTSRSSLQAVVSVRVSLRSRLSRRQRVFQLAYTVGAAMVALLALVLASSPTQSVLSTLFRPAMPQHGPTTITSSKNTTFFLQASPSWGKAYLDTHPLSQLVANDIAPVVLAKGHHTFTWVAAPFLPQSCTISIPRGKLDTCFSMPVDSNSGTAISKIVFSESLASLPEPALSALLGTAQAALDRQISTETVRPGERYVDVTKPGMMAVATQPLRATLRFELTTTLNGEQPTCLFIGQQCGFQVSDCRELCTIPQDIQPALPGWNVVAPVRAVWDYATLDGRLIAQGQPDELSGDFNSETLVSMQIERDGANGAGWRVSVGGTGQPFSDDLSCSIAEDGLGPFLDIGRVGTPHGSFSISFASDPSLATGCVAVVILESNTTTPTANPQLAAYCFYRFGLWLAVNQIAHQFWPTMPQANAYERSLAHTIMAAA